MAKAGLLFVGTDDGAVLFSNPNNIGRWLRIGQPFRGHAVRALWPLPDNPLVVFAAVDGMGVQRSDDGGQSWRAALDFEAQDITGHHSASNMLYVYASNGDVYRSEDAGEHWDKRLPDAHPVASGGRLVVGPDNARRLHLSQAETVWTSADAGERWTRYGAGLPAPITGLAVWPAGTDQLYAVAARALYVCSGAQARWERSPSAPSANGALAILAGKELVLLLARAGGGIERSGDAGATWAAAEVEGGVEGDVAVIAPVGYHIDSAFSGSTTGKLYTSTDRGRTWQLIKQDLPPVRSVTAARLA